MLLKSEKVYLSWCAKSFDLQGHRKKNGNRGNHKIDTSIPTSLSNQQLLIFFKIFVASSEYMNLTTAPLPQIFRSSFGPRSMRGNYKMVVLTGHFCANSLKVYGLYNSVAFLRSSSATENFAKKSKGIREGNQIK